MYVVYYYYHRPLYVACFNKHQLVERRWCLYGYNVVLISYGLLLLKCFDIKMVKLPGCSSVGASLYIWQTRKKKKNVNIRLWFFGLIVFSALQFSAFWRNISALRFLLFPLTGFGPTTRGQFHKLFFCPPPLRLTFAQVKSFSKSWA